MLGSVYRWAGIFFEARGYVERAFLFGMGIGYGSGIGAAQMTR